MARFFVSYSRKNKDFCRQLTTELQKHEMDFWVDWDDIPPTVDWRDEIGKGIEEADAFLAVVSPDWISSNICKEELRIAVKNGKRLIPVIPCELDWDSVPSDLSHLNYIFFTENFDFSQQLEKLLTALNTDYDWLKTHRRLQVKALEWDRSNKDNGFLLRGRDLDEAEQQISVNANTNPTPTDLQREYVLTSRQASTKQRRIITGILIGLIAGMLGIIVLLVKPYVQDAVSKSQAQNQSPMVTVPAGTIDFQLSDPVQNEIVYTQTYQIPEFSIEMNPVTNKVYRLCVNVDKCTPPMDSTEFNSDEKQNDPVVWLNIAQAATYCNWVGRRLLSAPEWEHAAGILTQSKANQSPFKLSSHYEWTSSYQDGTSKIISGNWDGQLNHLKNWAFLQEKGSLKLNGILELRSNNTGAFVANANLGFRCANK
jgi:formylglycine-generating enzyme required for sulfatase activity